MELKESVDKICLFLDVDLPKQRNIMKTCEVEYCLSVCHLLKKILHYDSSCSFTEYQIH